MLVEALSTIRTTWTTSRLDSHMRSIAVDLTIQWQGACLLAESTPVILSDLPRLFYRSPLKKSYGRTVKLNNFLEYLSYLIESTSFDNFC